MASHRVAGSPQKPVVTFNFNGSTFNVHRPSHLLAAVVMILLKQASVVTTECDRLSAKVCDFSSFHARSTLGMLDPIQRWSCRNRRE